MSKTFVEYGIAVFKAELVDEDDDKEDVSSDEIIPEIFSVKQESLSKQEIDNGDVTEKGDSAQLDEGGDRLLRPFENEEEFRCEMEKNIEDIVNESIGILEMDPREYHPFYLTVYKYVLLGQELGFVGNSENEVESIWKKFDKFAVSQWEKILNEKKFQFEGQRSTYLKYIQTRKVYDQDGNGIRRVRRGGIKRNKEIARALSSARQANRKWWTSNLHEKLHTNIREDTKFRLEFFSKVKSFTHPGDSIAMRTVWSAFLRDNVIDCPNTNLVDPINRKCKRKAHGISRKTITSSNSTDNVDLPSHNVDTERVFCEICGKSVQLNYASQHKRKFHPEQHQLELEKRASQRRYKLLNPSSTRMSQLSQDEKARRHQEFLKRKNMTEEQWKDERDRILFRKLEKKLQMTEEERDKMKMESFLRYQSWKSKFTREEWQQWRRLEGLRRKKNLTEEKRQQILIRNRERISNLTGEKLEQHRNIFRRGTKKYLDKMKKEDPVKYHEKVIVYNRKRYATTAEKMLIYQRKRIENETIEEREKRLLRYRVAQAKRNVKKQMEEEGKSQEEIETRLEQITEEVKNQPRSIGRRNAEYKPRLGARKPKSIQNRKTALPLHYDKPGEVDSVENSKCINLPKLDSEGTGISTIILQPETETVLVLPHQVSHSHPKLHVTTEVEKQNKDEFNIDLPPSQIPVSCFADSPNVNIGDVVDTCSVSKSLKSPTRIQTAQSPQQQHFGDISREPGIPISARTEQSDPIASLPVSCRPEMCEECGKSFKTKGNLMEHKKLVHFIDPSKLACPKCSHSCSNTRILWNHFVKCHVSNLSTFPKDFLPKKNVNQKASSSSTSAGLGNKKVNFNRGNKFPNICDQCGKTFRQKCTLDDHIRRVHEGRGHFCHVCSRQLQSAAKLWRHQVERHGMTNLPPPNGSQLEICKYCSEVLMRGYEQHVQKHHPEHFSEFKDWYQRLKEEAEKFKKDEAKPIKCPHCSSMLRNKRQVRRHIRHMHPEITTTGISLSVKSMHKCPDCGKDFKRKNHLVRHFREIHGVDKIELKLEAKQMIKITSKIKTMAVCLLCDDLQMSGRVSIRAHFVSEHHEVFQQVEAERLPMYFCELCKDKFHKEIQLRDHLESMHQDIPYRCRYCNVFKTSQQQLQQHERNVHGKESRKDPSGNMRRGRKPKKTTPADKMTSNILQRQSSVKRKCETNEWGNLEQKKKLVVRVVRLSDDKLI